jgi:signal transduction histidine kinase
VSKADSAGASSRGMPSIRDEILRSQLRPVLALAVAAATLIAGLIVVQYGWLRLQGTNPLDQIDAAELRPVLRAATAEQWPILTRWLAVHGLGMTVGASAGLPDDQARLPDGREVALSEVLSLVIEGQRVRAGDGQPLGPAPAAWLTAIARMNDRDAVRLAADPTEPATVARAWPALALRLDERRVAVLASPEYALAAREVIGLVALAFALTSAVVTGFLALFLVAFQRRFAARSAKRLSRPVERLAHAVRLATRERDAARRVPEESPAEVAQLAADFNRLQEHLAQALAERERVIAGQRDLVAALSHELRTPLAVLRGHAEVLSREPGTAARAQVMLRQVEDLHALLSDLLDMARLESIEATLAVEDVSLADMVAEMVARFGPAAWRQGVLLRPAETNDPALVARADPRWLRQIVANLLSNAIRHTPAGGLITLGALHHGDRACVLIEDTGGGLDATGAPPHDLAGRPAGIGLRVVRRLAAAMGGTLALETTEEGGIRATVALPEAR